MSWHTQTRPDFIVAAGRTARARQIVSAQHSLIGKFETSGKSSVNARKTLEVYESSPRHLEIHELFVRARRKARLMQTKKKGSSD